MSSLRAEQREVTRRKILGAVIDLVAEGTMRELSVPLVARRSGVSLATIYRYFPTRDDLLAAAAEEPTRRAALDQPIAEVTDGPAYLRQAWADFVTNLPLLRQQVASDAGREMRQRRYEGSKEWFATYLRDHGLDPESPEGARVLRLGLLLTSSLALLDLHDRQGQSSDDAAADVTWALEVLVAVTTTTTSAGAGRSAR